MFCKAISIPVCATMLGIIGCSHNKSDSSTSMPTTMDATTVPATSMPAATAKQSMMDKAKDLLKKGEALFAKGKIENNSDEQNQGQSMMDEAKKLLEKAKGMM